MPHCNRLRLSSGHHTNSTADVTGIRSQLDDRISGGFDEQTVEVLLMQARKSPELMRQRQDQMIIRYRQEFLLPPLEPCLDVALVAFRATAVTTGVIRILQPAAVITFKYMAPHGGRTASEYVLECASMTGQHSFAELLQILGAVASEDVCHFDHGSTADQSRLMSLLIFVWTSTLVHWDRCIPLLIEKSRIFQSESILCPINSV